MRRPGRIALVSGVIIVTLLLAPWVVLLSAPMTYAGLIQWAARTTTGAEVDFADLDVGLFPLQVSLWDLVLRNPEFERPLLTARNASAVVRVDDWLGGAPTWWRAAGDGVEVRLEQDSQGASNWQLGPPGPSEGSSGADRLLDFSVVQMTDLTITRAVGEDHRFRIQRLHLVRDADERLRVDVDGSYRDEPLHAQGTLVLPTSEQAQDVNLQANVFGSTVHVDGTVGHDGIAPGRADVRLVLRDPQALATLLDVDLAPLAPLSLAGTLVTPGTGTWRIDLEGQVAGRQAALAGTLNITERRYALSSLDVAWDDSRLRGQADVDTVRQSLQARMSAPRLNLTQLLAAAERDDAPSPEAEPSTSASPALTLPDALRSWQYDVTASVGELRYRDQQVSGLELSFARHERLPDAGRAGGAVLDVSANGLETHVELAFTPSMDTPPSIVAHGRLETLAAISAENQMLEALLPLGFDVHVSPLGDIWQIDLTRLAIAGSDLNGSLRVDAQSTPVRVDGTLQSTKLDINDFPTSSQLSAAAQGSGKEAAAENADGDLIPDSPLDWSWLGRAEVDVNAEVDRLVFNRTTFRNVRSRIELTDGVLRVDPLEADLARGGVRGHFEVARRDTGAALQAYLAVSQLVPADLGQPDSGLIDGGATDLLVDLRAEGRSPQDLAGSLNGELALEVQQAIIRNQLFEKLTTDLVSQTLRLVNPFVDQDPQTDLECAAAHIVADQGMLSTRNRLVVETSKVVIRAGGEIDLNDESLTIDFVPSPREGLGISVAGLAELVRIGGTLAEPELQTDASAILKGGATIGAAIGTGGLSLLAQGLFTRLRNQGTRCGRIFEQHTDLPQQIRVSEP